MDAFARDDAEVRVAGRCLLPFQVRGVRWMLREECTPSPLWGQRVPGGLLCDDMGLGKTLQTTSVIAHRPVPRTLVVTPVSVLQSWQEMLCSAGCEVYELQSGQRVRRVVMGCEAEVAGMGALDTSSSTQDVVIDLDADEPTTSSAASTSAPSDLTPVLGAVPTAGCGSMDVDDDDVGDPMCISESSDEEVGEEDVNEEEVSTAAAALGLRYAGAAFDIVHLPARACVIVSSYGRVKPRTTLVAEDERDMNVCPLADVAWDRIVLDEGHVIRNDQTLVHMRMRRLVRAPGCAAWVLSGTPIQKKVKDLFALLLFVGFNLAVVSRDERSARTAWGTKVMRRAVADMPAGMRRAMAFPSDEYAVHEHHVVYRSEEEAAFYRAATGMIERQLRALDGYADRRQAAQDRLVLINFLRMLAVHPQVYIDACNKQRLAQRVCAWPAWSGCVSKNEDVTELLRKWADEGASFLLFTHFNEELRSFERIVHDLGFEAFIICGKQSGLERHRILEESRQAVEEGRRHALLIQIAAGGVGLNAQHLDRVIIPSPSWNPCLEAQAIARCHRMNQTKRVQVHRFFLAEVQNASEQIEMHVRKRQAEKNALIARIVKSTGVF